MVTIEKIDTENKAQVKRFIQIPFRLYKDCPQWTPPLITNVKMQLNRKKHPWHEHSEADYFIAVKDGRDVGRIAALENKPFNKYHNKKQCQFYLFETEEDIEVATALFDTVCEWGKQRGLDHLCGPKGFGPMDGYGIQIEGFEHHQMMDMMNYNYPYYVKFMDELGFVKEVDFVSCYLSRDGFNLPERIRKIADRVVERGRYGVVRFTKRKELREWAARIGKSYNDTFIYNWEYYPLSQREIDYVVGQLLTYADPKLIKIITHGEDVIGFVFGFPDVTKAFKKANGKLNPLTMLGFLQEAKRTDWLCANGAGVLPEFQGTGGNALLYLEVEKELKDYNFIHAELTQVAETTKQMRADLVNLGGKPYKNHRVYRKNI